MLSIIDLCGWPDRDIYFLLYHIIELFIVLSTAACNHPEFDNLMFSNNSAD